jgi:DDE superfamily endonuclease
VVANRKAKILAVSKSHHGSRHDKKVYDRVRVLSPPGSTRAGDTAYIGTSVKTPHKKPKGKKLTPEQKKYNKAFSSRRVVVEHATGRMKRYQILAQRFRNPRRTHTLILKNIAGLANLAAE